MPETSSLHVVELGVTSSVSSGVAIITTLVRVYIRFRKHSLWIDDALAIISACLSLAQSVVVFVGPYRLNGTERYYVVSFLWLAIIWFSRLSMLFSLTRIAKGAIHPTRNLHIALSIFIFMYIFLTAQIAWECETKTAWKLAGLGRCSISKAVPACQLTADIVSDGILLIVPIQLFKVIQSRGLRYRLMLIFGTSIITTLASIPHSVFGFMMTKYPSILTALIENAVSLVVCNIPVLVTAIIRLKKTEDVPSSPNNLSLRFRVTTSRIWRPMTNRAPTDRLEISSGDEASEQEQNGQSRRSGETRELV